MQAGIWHVIPFIGEYEASSLSDQYKEIDWVKKRTCRNCGVCSLQLEHVFGRRYTHACEKAIVFTKPDVDDVACTKKLIGLRRKAVKDRKAKKHKCIAMKDRE